MRRYYWIIIGWIMSIVALAIATWIDTMIWPERTSLMLSLTLAFCFSFVWGAIAVRQFITIRNRNLL